MTVKNRKNIINYCLESYIMFLQTKVYVKGVKKVCTAVHHRF